MCWKKDGSLECSKLAVRCIDRMLKSLPLQVASKEEVQFGRLERWRLEHGNMALVGGNLREKITKPMHRKSARRATRQSIEIFRVVIHVFRGADKVERKFHHSLHMEWPTATTNCCSSYVDLVIDFIYDE